MFTRAIINAIITAAARFAFGKRTAGQGAGMRVICLHPAVYKSVPGAYWPQYRPLHLSVCHATTPAMVLMQARRRATMLERAGRWRSC